MRDPWEDLYRQSGADHLRAHLDMTEPVTETPAKSVETASSVEEVKMESRSVEKPTSIYEFFEDTDLA